MTTIPPDLQTALGVLTAKQAGVIERLVTTVGVIQIVGIAAAEQIEAQGSPLLPHGSRRTPPGAAA